MGRPRKIQNTETGDITTGKVSVEIIRDGVFLDDGARYDAGCIVSVSADMALALKNAGLATSQ